MHRRSDVHQPGVIRDYDVAEFHRGRCFKQPQLTAEACRPLRPRLIIDIPDYLIAHGRVGSSAKKEYFRVQFLGTRRSDACESISGPAFREVARTRTKSDDFFESVELQRRYLPRNAEKNLVGDMQFQPLAVIRHTQIVQWLDVAIDNGDDFLIQVLLQVHKHRALEYPFVDHQAPRTPQTSEVLAAEAVVDIDDEVVLFIPDFLLERPQSIESLTGVKFIRMIQVLIRSHELRILRPGHVVDLPLRKPCA